jgi:serine/threonine protein kinase
LVDADTFVAGLTEFGLLEPAEIKACLDRQSTGERPADTAAIARELVRTGQLTRYQATAIARGQARGLVMGDYVVLEKIGAGGMGTVFKARHRRTKRNVAVKVLFPNVTRNSKAVPRLQREALAAAQLSHPNLVSALDLDEIGGMHVFVMDYVEGCDLSRMVKSGGPLSIDRALDCMIQAARGLQAAHERGIIHRDVKPANLMLDANGTLKVLDLGLARVDQHSGTGADDDEYADGLTNPGTVLGTVDYMAPEQAMNSRSVDARSDVYSLGCTLYYLLVGRPPYRGGGALERLLRHREAPIPSMRAERPQVPPVLDEILGRMLAKAPADRFASMSELIAALDNCRKGLDADTVENAPPPPADGRKPKKPLQTFTTETEKETESLTPTPEGTREDTFLDLKLEPSDSLLPKETSVHSSVSASKRPSTFFGAAALGLVAVVGIAAYAFVSSRNHTGSSTSASVTQPGDDESHDLRPPDVKLPNLRPGPRNRMISTKPDPNLATARDRSTASMEVTPSLTDTAKPKLLPADSSTAPATVKTPTVPAFAPFGEERVFSLHARGPVRSVAVASNGKRAVSGGDDQNVRVWDATTGESIFTLTGHGAPVLSVAISADGRRAITGSADGTLLVWDLDTGREFRRLSGHAGAVRAVGLSADGTRAVSGGADKFVRVWDVEKGSLLAGLKEHLEAVNAVAISADGHYAVSGGDDKVVRYWSLEIRKQLRRFKDHTEPVRAVALGPDGRHALSGGDDGRVRAWDLKGPKYDRPVWRAEEPGQRVGCVAITEDGRRAIGGTESQGLIVWDAKTGREYNRFPAPAAFLGVALPQDGQRALTAQNDGSIRVWNLPPQDSASTSEAFTIEGRYPVIQNANALELSAWADRMKRNGFLPTLVNGHDSSGIPHYAALAMKNSAGTSWEIRLDEGPADVQKTFKDMMDREYWVISQSGYPLGSSLGLISVWIPKRSLPVGGSYHGATRVGWETFLTEYQVQAAKKLHLTALTIYPLGNDRLFAGLWTPDDGTPLRPPLVGLGPQELETALKDARRDSYHPVSLAAYSEGDETRYGVVMHRDLPGLRWEVSRELSPESLQQELARQIAKGFHPLLLTGYPRLQTSRYTVVWVNDRIQPPKRLGTDTVPAKIEMSRR